MSHYEQLWLLAFIKTQVVEVSLGLLTLYVIHTRRPTASSFHVFKLSLIILIASALTHPPLWFIFPSLRKSWGFSYQQYVLFGEIFVCLVEGVWYSFALQPLKRRLYLAMLFSLYLNSASYLLGRYVW